MSKLLRFESDRELMEVVNKCLQDFEANSTVKRFDFDEELRIISIENKEAVEELFKIDDELSKKMQLDFERDLNRISEEIKDEVDEIFNYEKVGLNAKLQLDFERELSKISESFKLLARKF